MGPPQILISNDDGIQAPGLRMLARALAEVGEVWIVAPDRERSATSHSISLHRPLRLREIGPREYSVDGTPTDSVYLGLHHVMPAPPDIVVSGINDGPNLGNDVLYSGTVSAAMEGALFGHRAIAVSLCLPEAPNGQPRRLEDFAPAAAVAKQLVHAVLAKPMPRGVLLNVNVPFGPRDAIRGIKLCRLGFTDWADVVTARVDPRGKPYFWIGGERTGYDEITDSDNNAIATGCVAVTPIHYDVTDYRSFSYARSLEVEGLTRVDDGLGEVLLPHPVVHARTPSRSKKP